MIFKNKFPYILLSFMLINASNILYLFLQTKSSVNFQSLELYTLFLCIYILNFVFLKSQNNFSPTIKSIKINSLVFFRKNQKKLNHVFIRQFSSTPSTTFFGETSIIEAFLLFLNCIFLGIVYYLNSIIIHLKNENLRLMETVYKVNAELLEVKEILNTNFQQLDKIESLAAATDFKTLLLVTILPLLVLGLGFFIIGISVDQSQQIATLAEDLATSSDNIDQFQTTIMEHTKELQAETLKSVTQVTFDVSRNIIRLMKALGEQTSVQHKAIFDCVTKTNLPMPEGSVLPILEQMDTMSSLL
jgi:hypothetical protein